MEQSSARGIQVDIVTHHTKVFRFLAINRYGLVTALKKMTALAIRKVVTLGIGPLKPFHAGNKIARGGLQQKVIMVRHQNITMNKKASALAGFPERSQKFPPVAIGIKDRLTPISTAHHMIHRPGIFNSYTSGHDDDYPTATTLMSTS